MAQDTNHKMFLVIWMDGRERQIEATDYYIDVGCFIFRSKPGTYTIPINNVRFVAEIENKSEVKKIQV